MPTWGIATRLSVEFYLLPTACKVLNPSPLRGPPLSLRAEEEMITSSIPFASWCIFAPLPEGTVANKREQSYACIDSAEREQLGR